MSARTFSFPSSRDVSGAEVSLEILSRSVTSSWDDAVGERLLHAVESVCKTADANGISFMEYVKKLDSVKGDEPPYESKSLEFERRYSV